MKLIFIIITLLIGIFSKVKVSEKKFEMTAEHKKGFAWGDLKAVF